MFPSAVTDQAEEPQFEEAIEETPEEVEVDPQTEVDMGAIPPDAVSYHGGDENCGACEYMLPEGTCAWLQIRVDQLGHCNLFETREDGATDIPTGEGE